MADQAELTPREREVLDLLRLGLTNEEMAGRLGITLDGAKYHVSQIISKLGVRDRYEAASWAERRPGSTAGLAPLGLLWNRASGVLPMKLSGIASMAAAAVLVVTIGGLGLIIFLFVQTEGEPKGTADAVTQLTTAQEDGDGDVDLEMDPLGGRDLLSICVAGGTGGSSEEAVETVGNALEAVLLEYPSTSYGRRELSAGCPDPTELLGTPITEYALRGPVVEVAGDAGLFVYLIDPLLYTATFGDDPFALGVEEFICESDICIPVTRSLYVPASVKAELLQTGLAESLGLIWHNYLDDGSSIDGSSKDEPQE